jgi:hypothetical protein
MTAVIHANLLAVLVLAVELQGTGATVSVRAARPAILAGEPLLLTVTVRNFSDAEVLLPDDAHMFPRTTTGPGLAVQSPPRPALPDYGYGVMRAAAGEEKSVRIVAEETAQLRRPGEYRMTVLFPPLGLSSDLSFTVLPGGPTALGRRADELYSMAIGGDVGEALLARTALAAMDPDVSAPRLCAVLKMNPDALDTKLSSKLEQIASPSIVGCLIDILPGSRGVARSMVASALKRIAGKTTEVTLREKIQRALAAD